MVSNRYSSVLLACAATCLWVSAASATDFSSAGKCSFAKRPPVVLKDSQIEGFCKFDHATQLFGGTPAEQARCLLNPVEPVGRLGAAMDALPAALESVSAARPICRHAMRSRDCCATAAPPRT